MVRLLPHSISIHENDQGLCSSTQNLNTASIYAPLISKYHAARHRIVPFYGTIFTACSCMGGNSEVDPQNVLAKTEFTHGIEHGSGWGWGRG